MASFSALRIEGKRAYEYARSNQDLPQELKPRVVKVANLELVEWFDEHSYPAPKEEVPEEEKTPGKSIGDARLEGSSEEPSIAGPACKLRMTVSSGFYVRSLCHDLGMKLDSGAYMAELVRTRQGDFALDNAVEWTDFVEGGGWEEKVIRILEAQGRTDKDGEKAEPSADPDKD